MEEEDDRVGVDQHWCLGDARNDADGVCDGVCVREDFGSSDDAREADKDGIFWTRDDSSLGDAANDRTTEDQDCGRPKHGVHGVALTGPQLWCPLVQPRLLPQECDSRGSCLLLKREEEEGSEGRLILRRRATSTGPAMGRTPLGMTTRTR